MILHRKGLETNSKKTLGKTKNTNFEFTVD